MVWHTNMELYAVVSLFTAFGNTENLVRLENFGTLAFNLKKLRLTILPKLVTDTREDTSMYAFDIRGHCHITPCRIDKFVAMWLSKLRIRYLQTGRIQQKRNILTPIGSNDGRGSVGFFNLISLQKLDPESRKSKSQMVVLPTELSSSCYVKVIKSFNLN